MILIFYHRRPLYCVIYRDFFTGSSLSGIDFTELTILRIEKGIRFVPDYELSVIADYFHVTSDYLLGRTSKE